MQRLISFLLRVVLLGVGLVLAAVLLLTGLLFTVVLMVVSLVRGRRPRVVRFRMDPRDPFAAMRQRAYAPAQARGEVVDIEARVVPDQNQQLKRDDR